MTFELYVGLMLNIDRVRIQRAAAVAQGNRMAEDTGPLPYEWAEAVSIDEAEAQEILYRVNRARAEARVAAKWGM